MLNLEKYGYYAIPGVITLIMSLAGTMLWFIYNIWSLADTPNQMQTISSIDLAMVTATLGGLVLIGAFYKGRNECATLEEKEYTSDLKLIGKLILISSACFVIIYFSLECIRSFTLPLSPGNWLFIIVTDIIAITAILSLSTALGFLITIIRFL